MGNELVKTKFNNWTFITIALLFTAFIIHIALHVNQFYVPESDFFDFREKAITICHLEWPSDSKRPPLFSALIAGVSLFISGQNRELYAAEIINVLAAILSFFIIYRIGKKVVGKYVFFILWFWTFHPNTLRMIVKPKSEILVTVLILWAFERFLSGDRWAYFIAFFATLVRYEGALAIFAFGMTDLFFEKQKIKTILYSILSGSFIIFWTLFQTGGKEGVSYGNYFSDYQPNFSYVKTFLDVILVFLPVVFFKIWVFILSVFSSLGIIYYFLKNKKNCLAVLLFLAGFFIMHTIWPMGNADYPIIVSWSVMLFVTFGIIHISKFLMDRYKDFILTIMQSKLAAILSILLPLISIIIIARTKFQYSKYDVSWGVIIMFLLPLFLFLYKVLDKSKSKILLFSSASAIFLLLGFRLCSASNGQFYDIRYTKAEYRLVGEWYDKNYINGDILVVDQPTIISYYTSLDLNEDFIRLIDLPDLSRDQLYRWLLTNKVTYVAWLSGNRIFQNDDKWYQWKRDNRGWKIIAFLEEGKNIDGFQVVQKIKCGPRWAFIYKIIV